MAQVTAMHQKGHALHLGAIRVVVVLIAIVASHARFQRVSPHLICQSGAGAAATDKACLGTSLRIQ